MDYKITHKLTKNGTHVGYEYVDESGNMWSTSPWGLLSESVFFNLKRAGYKLYGYDPNKLALNDNFITNLPSREVTPDDEEQLAYAMDPLPETEICGQISYSDKSSMVFAKPDPQDIVIHTREELISFLAFEKKNIEVYGYTMNPLPINAITEPEALFTIDEITKSNGEEGESMQDNTYWILDLLLTRTSYIDMQQVEQVKDFLRSKGLKCDTFTEFRVAMLHWGFDGIKDSCTSMKMDEHQRNTLSSGNLIHENTVSTVGVLYNDRHIHVNGQDYAVTGTNKDIIKVGDQTMLQSYLLKMSDMHKSAMLVKCTAPVFNDIISMFFWNENISSSYVIKLGDHEIAMGWVGRDTLFYRKCYTVMSTINRGVFFPLKDVWDNKYMLYESAATGIYAFTFEQTKSESLKSSFQLLIDAGFGPVGAVKYMYFALKNYADKINAASILQQYSAITGIANFLKYGLQAIPDAIAEKVSSINDSIDLSMPSADIANAILADDNFLNDYTANKKVEATMDMVGKTFYEEDFIRPWQWALAVKFFNDCVAGGINVDNYGEGLAADKNSITGDIISAFAIYADSKYGDQAIEVLRNSFVNVISDIYYNDVLSITHYAYDGNKADKVKYAKMKRDSAIFFYALDTFKELGIDDNLCDWGFRALMVAERDSIVQSIERLVMESPERLKLTEQEKTNITSSKEVLNYFAKSVSLEFLYARYLNKDTIRIGDDKEFNLSDFSDILKYCQVKDHIRIISCYEFCENELYEMDSRVYYSCVNATITPWTVEFEDRNDVIDDSAQHKRYHMLINFYDDLTFKNYSDGFKEKMKTAKILSLDLDYGRGTPVDHFKNPTPKIAEPFINELLVSGNWNDMGYFLDETVNETYRAYITRFMSAWEAYKSTGLKIMRMRVKSDYRFSELANMMGISRPDEQFITATIANESRNYWYNVEPEDASLFKDSILCSDNLNKDALLIATSERMSSDDMRELLLYEVNGKLRLNNMVMVNGDLITIANGGIVQTVNVDDFDQEKYKSLIRVCSSGTKYLVANALYIWR